MGKKEGYIVAIGAYSICEITNDNEHFLLDSKGKEHEY